MTSSDNPHVPNKPQLPIHEKLAVIIIIAGMVFLTLLTTFNQGPEPRQINPTPHYMSDPEIEVYVQGAVQNPGSYKLMQGANVGDVLNLAQPLDDADLSKVKMQTKARRGQVIKIPKIETLTVYLEGAVKTPGPVLMRKGAKLQDLLDNVKFAENANLKPLNKKRKLKDKEVIRVDRQG